VVNAGRTVYGLAPDSGRQRWTFRLDGSVVGRGRVAGEVVFVSNKDANGPTAFYALDAATGKVRWKSPLGGDVADGPRYVYDTGPDTPDPTGGTPGTVYLTAHDTLYALDVKTGRQRWAIHAGPFVSCWGPVGGLVYAYETNGDTLTALNADTGTTAWTHRAARVWRVVADKNAAYLLAGGDDDNYHQIIYALRSAT
jgi:outer membrane protein assembly factor BamB